MHLNVLAAHLHRYGESELNVDAQLFVDPGRHHDPGHLGRRSLVVLTGRKRELRDSHFPHPTLVFLPVDVDGLLPSGLVAGMDVGSIRKLDAHDRHYRRWSLRRWDFGVLFVHRIVDPSGLAVGDVKHRSAGCFDFHPRLAGIQLRDFDGQLDGLGKESGLHGHFGGVLQAVKAFRGRLRAIIQALRIGQRLSRPNVRHESECNDGAHAMEVRADPLAEFYSFTDAKDHSLDFLIALPSGRGSEWMLVCDINVGPFEGTAEPRPAGSDTMEDPITQAS